MKRLLAAVTVILLSAIQVPAAVVLDQQHDTATSIADTTSGSVYELAQTFTVGVAGWVSVMLSVWFLGGLSILFIGVIGMYLSKVFIETKQRPYVIVRAVYHDGRAQPTTSQPKG